MEDLHDVARHIARVLPGTPGGAAPNDGLLIGDLRQPVRRLLLAAEFTAEVAEEAISVRADMVLTLRTPWQLPLAGGGGRHVRDLVASEIALYSVEGHSAGIVAEAVGGVLGLEESHPLIPTQVSDLAMLVAYTPVDNAEELRRALAEAGAGAIGDYTGCAWSVTGTGEFTPSDGADPTIGTVGTHEQVSERRLEMVVPTGLIDSVTEALRRAHPYEEPAFSFLPTLPAGGRTGRGRVGDLPTPVTLGQLRALIVEQVPGTAVRSSAGEVLLHRAAISARAGEEEIAAAVGARAGVLISSDLSSDHLHLARSRGLHLLDIPRSPMLWMALPTLARAIAAGTGAEIEMIVSTAHGPAWKSE